MDEEKILNLQDKLDKMFNFDDLEDFSNIDSVLSHIIPSKTYKCPICGKEHNLDDCVIIKEETGRRFLKRTFDRQLSTYRTKVYQDHYLVSYYNIRICPKCGKKRNIPYLIISVLFIIILVALMIRNTIMLPEKDFGIIIGQIILVLLGGGFLGLVILGGLAWLIQQCQKIDIEKAKENNAIVPSNSFMEL